MDVNTLFIVILGILVLDYLFNLTLDYLNTTRWNDEIPEALKEMYDPENYARSQAYLKTTFRFGLLVSFLSFLAILALVSFGLFGRLDEWLAHYIDNPVWQALAFFAILALGADLLSIPFSLYSTFVIEEKFGFNKTTFRTFLTDKVKGWLLMGLLGGGILALIVWIYYATGSYFWLYVWGVLALFSIFMSMFYSTLIVPLFNKQEKLEAGSLREAIEHFAQKAGFHLQHIFTIDGSKRSTKANAYFSGLGPKKRIVLYDTLIEKQKDEEIVAVLAHEIGHYRKKHILSGLGLSLMNSLLTLYILSLFIRPESDLALSLAQSLGAETFSFHLGILAFGILYGPLSFLTGMILNVWSRKNEFEADAYAASYGMAEPLRSALIKLSVDSLSNLQPHPAYVFFHYSHPPLLKRLEALRKAPGAE